MKSQWEQFSAAYQKADPGLQRLVDSDAISKFVSELVSEITETERLQHNLVIMTANRCLGVISGDELETQVQELVSDTNERKLVSAKIQAFCDNPPDIEADLGLSPEAGLTSQQSSVTAPASNNTTVSSQQIDALRQQALVVWGQYLSAPVSTNTATYKAQVQTLAEQVATAQASGAAITASNDPGAYWHEAVTRSRSRLPEIDNDAIARIRSEFSVAATEPKSIINAIKGSAS